MTFYLRFCILKGMKRLPGMRRKRSEMAAEKKKKKKKGGPVNAILTLGILLCVGVIAYSGYKLISTHLAYQEGENEYSSLLQYTTQTHTKEQEEKPEDPGEPPIEAVTGDSAEDGDPEDVPPIQVDFAALRKMNPDIVGWLYIGALDISYPVVQGTDNEYYLHRTFEGKDNFAGSIFVECQNSGDWSDCNTIVYGHNMKNQTMFGKLNFLQEWEKYQEHMDFWILTPEGDYRYEIFNAQYTDAYSDVYTLFSGPGEAFLEYLDKMQSQAQISLPAREFSENDRIVTLSTCASSQGDERYVVQGVRTLEP